METIICLRCDHRIHQIEVDHRCDGHRYKEELAHALCKADSVVGEHLSVMGGGPLGYEARLGLCIAR